MKVKKERDFLAEELYDCISREFEEQMRRLTESLNLLISSKSTPESSENQENIESNSPENSIDYMKVMSTCDDVHRLSKIVKAIYAGDFTEEAIRAMISLSHQGELLYRLNKVLKSREQRLDDSKNRELWQSISDWIHLI
jgi:hypothetical protein